MAKYTIFPGKFQCHTCKSEVGTLRLYESSKVITWMCSDRHVSSVSLQTRKNKRDYERKV
jgi:hypothetical protein